MSFGSGGNSRRPLAEINITPLVDVMLVLLIIFMVTAPLLQTGVKVDLPQAKAAPLETKQDERLVLSITKDRRVFLLDAEIALGELQTKLQTNAKVQKDKELFLHADRSLPYGVVIEVMAIARGAGVDSLGMITDPPEVARQ